jgi:hypothetical protein
MLKETLKQRDKRKLDLQLDEELEGTFPASDPLKITRFSSKIHTSVKPSKKKDAAVSPFGRSPERTQS